MKRSPADDIDLHHATWRLAVGGTQRVRPAELARLSRSDKQPELGFMRRSAVPQRVTIIERRQPQHLGFTIAIQVVRFGTANAVSI